MTTLSEQLNNDSKNRIQKFNDQHFEWLMRYEALFTHALTLTFHPKRIQNLINKSSNSHIMAKSDLLELQKKSFNFFANRVNRSLFGNSSDRHRNKLLLLPMLEGQFIGCHTHYHCVLGVSEDRFEVIEAKVRDAWRETPLAGNQINVKRYRDIGWIDYMNKQAKFVNRESIDWSNVRIPVMLSQFQSIAE